MIKRLLVLFLVLVIGLSFVNAVENLNETSSEDQKQEKYDPDILDEFNNQTWLRVIVYYQSDVENLNFDTIEERKEYVRNLTHSLFDYIPSTKMRNIKTGLSNSFTAEITKEGFDELIENAKLSEIYLDTTGSIELDESNTSAEYDSKIMAEFNKSPEVRVTIKLRDTSNITVSSEDSIEEQTLKDLRRKELFQEKRDIILSKLSESEFQLLGEFATGSGFYGNITKEGYNKLINDPYIERIYLTGISYIVSPVISSDIESKYETKILEEFASASEVPVLVKIQNQNISNIDEILSRIPVTEFKLKKKLQAGNGFSGNITLRGFNILINDPNVKMVYLSEPLHVLNEEKYHIESQSSNNNSYVNKTTPEKSESWIFKIIHFIRSLFNL